MTDEMKHLIVHSNYLIDYEAREYTVLDSKKSPEEIYEQLCNDYELYQPYALDVEDFEDWVNHNYTAFEVLGNDEIDLAELEETYRSEVLDPAIENFFTDSEYFAWL